MLPTSGTEALSGMALSAGISRTGTERVRLTHDVYSAHTSFSKTSVLTSRDVLVYPGVSGTLVNCLGNNYKHMRTMRKRRRGRKKESMMTTEKEHNRACSMGQASF